MACFVKCQTHSRPQPSIVRDARLPSPRRRGAPWPSAAHHCLQDVQQLQLVRAREALDLLNQPRHSDIPAARDAESALSSP